MKKKILVVCLVVVFGFCLNPGESRAISFLNNWYIDLDGPGGAAPDQIYEYLDQTGISWTNNTLTSPTTAVFDEWGAAISTTYDGSGVYTASRQLTATLELSGTVSFPGSVSFDPGGIVNMYSDPTYNYGANDGIPGATMFGADDGTLIATFQSISGNGLVDPTGLPNGLISIFFEATYLAPGYWIMPDGTTDMSSLPPLVLVLGFSTTNASYVQNVPANVVNEIIGQFAGQSPGFPDYTNVPPEDFVASINGQWRMAVVPEPASMLLLGSGLLGLAGLGRRRFRKKD